VRPLTRNEIKKDLNLIESYYDSDDSDTSVSSSEAITSSYPVKPRNFAKLAKRDEHLLQAKVVPHSHIDVGAGVSMDDAIEFMKAVEAARSDIYEAEKERENLEIRYQVGIVVVWLAVLCTITCFLFLLSIRQCVKCVYLNQRPS
jgi:hypothetical protein